MSKIVQILMQRDNCTKEQAEQQVAEARKELAQNYSMETLDEILDDMGLEMDYAMELIL